MNDAHINARNMIIDSVDELGNRVQMAGNPVKVSGCEDPVTRPAAPGLDADREKNSGVFGIARSGALC